MTNAETLLASMPGHARVWIYMADRSFTEQETVVINERIQAFTAEWAAHGHALKAMGTCLHNRFVVLAVDEMAHGASGCSIDSSVRFIRELAESLQTEFFNRQLMGFRADDGSVKSIPFTTLNQALASGQINEKTPVFNNLVSTVDEWRANWERPLAESPYARLV